MQRSPDCQDTSRIPKKGLFCYGVHSLRHHSLTPISHTPCQIFSMFFCHLTTSITEVEIYLRKNPTLCDNIPKQLRAFKDLFEKAANSMVVGGFKLIANKAHKKADSEKTYMKTLAREMTATAAHQMTAAEKFITELNWTLVKYHGEWEKNTMLMPKKKPFTWEHRVDTRRGARLLVMSGLSWNLVSHNKSWDWTNVAATVTLETGLVESYHIDF